MVIDFNDFPKEEEKVFMHIEHGILKYVYDFLTSISGQVDFRSS